MHRLPEFDDAVQDLSEALDRRLVIINDSMRTVAYSIHETPEDRQRLSHVLAHSTTWLPPQTAKHSHCFEDLPEIGTTLFVRLINSRQHIIGHLVIPLTAEESTEGQIDDAITNTVLSGAERLSDFMETWLQDADDKAARSHEHTVKLVTGNSYERAEAAAALLSDRILSASDQYCVVALGVDPRTATQQDHEKAALAVSRTVQFVNDTSTATVAGGTLEDDVGVLIFPRPVVIPRLIRILEEPQLAHIRAGIGPLTHLSDIQRSFQRARTAWRASYLAPDDHAIVVAWDELGLDGTLARLPLEDFTLDDLPAATKELLANLDSSVLLDTLEAYLVAGGDAQQTARVLNIHRSTLYYRLDKVRKAVPGDLSDGILRRELHTGLRIAKLAKLL